MKRDFLYIAGLIILSILYFNSCSNDLQTTNNLDHNDKVDNDSLEYYKNELKLVTAQKLAYKGTEIELKRIIERKENDNSQLSIALKKWKKIASATKVTTNTKIKVERIPFLESVPFTFNREFKKVDEFYSIFGNVNNFGVALDSISILNTQTIVSGKKKVGFLKTEYRFEVINSNPYIKTIQADSYNFVEKNKRFGIGVIGGYGLSSGLKTNFFIGIGVGYDLIQF